jgi:two-component system, NtrC family, sensor kinase
MPGRKEPLKPKSAPKEGSPVSKKSPTPSSDGQRKELASLREKIQQYQNLLERSYDIIFQTDPQGRFTYLNSAAERVTGYPRDELIGKSYLDLIHPDSREEAARVYEMQFSQKIVNTYFELPLLSRTGRVIWIGQQVQVLMDQDRVTGFQAVARDISRRRQAEESSKKYQEELEEILFKRTSQIREKKLVLEKEVLGRRRTEAQLRESEQHYRSILESIADGYYECDLKGTLTFCNESFCRILGSSNQELIGANYRLFTHEKDVGRVSDGFKNVFLTGLPSKGIDHNILTRDGAIRRIESSSTLMRDSTGQAVGFVGIARDITDLVKTREALREREFYFRTVIEISPDAFITINTDRRITDCNPAFLRLFGFPREEVIGASTQLIHPSPEQYARLGQILYPEMEKTGSCRIEWEFKRRDGTVFPAEIVMAALKGPEGKTQFHISMLRDITQRKQFEKKLQRSFALTSQIINSIVSIVIAVNAENRVVFWNTQAEAEFEILSEKVMNKCLEDCGLPLEYQAIQEALDQTRAKEGFLRIDNLKFKQRNGKDGYLGLSLHPIRGEEFGGTGVLIHGANVTRRINLEMQLAQAQKLESIGQLAAGIAHEINTPIQYVSDNTRFFQSAFKDLVRVLEKYAETLGGPPGQDKPEVLYPELEGLIREIDLEYYLEEIPRAIDQTLEGVEQVGRIVRSIKAFAHPGPAEKKYLDINQAIENTILVSHNEWKYVAELVPELDRSLPTVPCLPGDFNQVILNLIVNAAQAIAEKVGNDPTQKGWIRIRTSRNGPFAEIQIEDNGPGIPEAIRSKVFDPFFTTKEVGKGTGQGLAISHTSIVEKHGGSLTLESEEGQGTVFIIRLPLEEPDREKGPGR